MQAGRFPLSCGKLGVANRYGKQLLALFATDVDTPSRPLALTAHFQIHGDELGQLAGLLNRRQQAAAIIVLAVILSHEIEEVLSHCTPLLRVKAQGTKISEPA